MLKFSVHTEGLEAIKDKLANGCTKAEHKVATEILSDTDPYVPFLNGVLSESARVVNNYVIYGGQFVRYWNSPDTYIPMLSKFSAICSPDFSTYTDMPLAMQIYNQKQIKFQ